MFGFGKFNVDFHLFYAVDEISTYLFQVDRSDGSCFFKSCVALCLAHDSGAPVCSINVVASESSIIKQRL
jgi:hypothetical protein